MTQLDPATVRACIEAVEAVNPRSAVMGQNLFYSTNPTDEMIRSNYRRALEALLPDPAEELLREWADVRDASRGFQDGYIPPQIAGAFRWLTQNYTLEKK